MRDRGQEVVMNVEDLCAGTALPSSCDDKDGTSSNQLRSGVIAAIAASGAVALLAAAVVTCVCVRKHKKRKRHTNMTQQVRCICELLQLNKAPLYEHC